MWIAVDAMGGDDAPRQPVHGALRAADEFGISVFLVGDEVVLTSELDLLKLPAEITRRVEIVHAGEVVDMDEPAITPIRRKRNASIRVGAQLVRDGRARALVSAGNTGATMICAKMVIGTSQGVDRPALAATLPNPKGHSVLLDVGANIDCKPHHFRQFAVMGYFYAQEIVGVEEPRIGLLSIGEEEGKGSDSVKEAFKVLEEAGLNFVGNVEGSDVFSGDVDVIVCDGFVGNVLLKSAESLADMVTSMLREEFESRFWSRIGYLLATPSLKSFRRRTDYSEYGGAPLLGVEGGCFIAHGRSDANAIKNAVKRAVEFEEHGIASKVSDKLREITPPKQLPEHEATPS
jgi:glycerol-3-phosphate acyltransferase PlsX